MRIALFGDVTQRIVVILYRRLGTTYWYLVQGSRNIFLALEDGTDRLSPDVDKELQLR